MNKNTLITAVTEAHRFLARAEELQQKYDELQGSLQDPFLGSKESGAVRRASMDLTRALAELRKYG